VLVGMLLVFQIVVALGIILFYFLKIYKKKIFKQNFIKNLGGCSQWVPNKFPKFSNGFLNMFPIAPCFSPISFALSFALRNGVKRRRFLHI